MANDGATQTGATAAELEQQKQTQDQIDADAKATAAEAERERKQHEDEMRQRAAEPRMTEMERIADERRKGMEARGELHPVVTEGEGETEDERADREAETERARLEAEAKKARDTEEQLRRQAGGGEPTVLKSEDLGKFKVIQTIDGESREVSLEQVVREHQKGGAADFRLAKASEALDRAEKLEKEAAARAAGKKPEGETGTTTDDEDAADPKVKEAIDLMLDGETEKAAKILNEAISSAKGRSATPDSEAIVAQATHRIKMETELNSFNTDYKDVVNDKYLAPLVDREFSELVKDANGQPTPLPPNQFGKKLREAGDKVRAWRDGLSGKPKDDPASKELEDRKAREARKENLDQTTGASTRSSSTATTSAEPTQASRSSAIAEIAKARGQQL